jgi:hypothetical protein
MGERLDPPGITLKQRLLIGIALLGGVAGIVLAGPGRFGRGVDKESVCRDYIATTDFNAQKEAMVGRMATVTGYSNYVGSGLYRLRTQMIVDSPAVLVDQGFEPPSLLLQSYTAAGYRIYVHGRVISSIDGPVVAAATVGKSENGFEDGCSDLIPTPVSRS